jgi:hypothetical protein
MTVPHFVRSVDIHRKVLLVDVLNFRPKRPRSHVLIADIMSKHVLTGKNVSREAPFVILNSYAEDQDIAPVRRLTLRSPKSSINQTWSTIYSEE